MPERNWLGMHVYYTSNPNPVLVNCVRPLVRELTELGLIQRYFFIRYWLEGPHVRLRLLPAAGVTHDAIKAVAEERVAGFLRARPAVYEVDPAMMNDIYKQMFLSEYTQEQWNEAYGEDGVMPIHPNNSWIYVDYEPEYDRYGGPAGIEIAEWHFEKSSDMVIDLVRRANVHVRTVLLGLSAQVMTTMCATFLRDPKELSEFLDGYSSFWEQTYEVDPVGKRADFDKLYDEMAEGLVRRTGEIHAATADAAGVSELGAFLRPWAQHCAELRDRIVAETRAGNLIFPARDGSGTRGPAVDPELSLRVLLGAYLHMTNNRMGVVINDEAYLGYVLSRAVLDAAGAAA